MKKNLLQLTCILTLLSCNQVQKKNIIENENNRVEDLTYNLQPFAVIDCNSNFEIRPVFSALVARDVFLMEGDSIMTLLDYMPGNVYYYNIKSNMFISEFSMPREENGKAKLFKTYQMDSVLYFNSKSQEFVLADSIKIIKKWKFNHFYGDSAAKIITVRNRLEVIGNKIPMMIMLSHSAYSAERFNQIKQNVPVLGLFEIQGDSLNYQPIPFYDPILEKEGTVRLGNRPLFLTNPKKNQIIYTYKNTDSLFIYDVEKEQSYSTVIKNPVHPIEPIIWKGESPDDRMTAEEEMEMLSRKSGVTDIVFSEAHNLFYRHINVRDGKDKGNSFLQVLTDDFTVLKEFQIPDKYQRGLTLINDQLFFTYYDREQQQIICEKFILPID
ncbi:MAG: hypothetical protein ACJAV5_000019 [Vicingaceae bacterium]|jgi:hypothetical protein